MVAFGRDDAKQQAWAWLWADGRWKLQIDQHREQVDTWCGQRSHSAEALSWHATCLEGYSPTRSAFVEVEPQSFAGGYGIRPARLKVTGFDRRTYHLEEGVGGQVLDATVGKVLQAMGVPGDGPSRYWFGDAHVQLDAGAETVQFKMFVPRVDDDYEFLHNTRWWEPSELLPGASPWFSVHARGYLEYPGEAKLQGTTATTSAFTRSGRAASTMFRPRSARYRPAAALRGRADPLQPGHRRGRARRRPQGRALAAPAGAASADRHRGRGAGRAGAGAVVRAAAGDDRDYGARSTTWKTAPTCGWTCPTRRCATRCPRRPAARASWCCACRTCSRRPRKWKCCCARTATRNHCPACSCRCCTVPRSVPTTRARPAASTSCARTSPRPLAAMTPRWTSS
ncbi:hypothetical protein H1235_02090 [Pseudoxanthomonas sp. NC8]|nr:hypothetical protein H1235_02090 [Pseudoxanthomonas sp. NC8]